MTRAAAISATLAVALLCTTVHPVRSQYYEAEHTSYENHHPESENDAEDVGFVTPLDFLPLFGSIHEAESSPSTNVFTIFPASSEKSGFYVGESALDEQFSPENFGFIPTYSQGLAAGETVLQPKTFPAKPADVESKKAIVQRSTLTKQPAVQFNVENKHAYKKPTQSQKEPLAPYRKYNFQSNPSHQVPAFQQPLSSAGSYLAAVVPGYSQAHALDAKLHRFKRYTNKKRKQKKKRKVQRNQEDGEDDDEYSYLSDYKIRPKQFDSGRYDSPDFSIFGKSAKIKEYDYGSDEEYGMDEYERIKSLSEQEAAEASKDPKNCVEVKKESMTCKVCKNPQTGGSYESCSYASEPQNNKYAYVKQQKFDSQDEPTQESQNKDKAELKEQPTTEQSQEASPGIVSSSSDSVESKPQRGSAKYQQDFINIKPQKVVDSTNYQSDYSNHSPQKSKPNEPKYSTDFKHIKSQKLIDGPKYQGEYSHIKPQKYRSYYTQPQNNEKQQAKATTYAATYKKAEDDDEESEEDDESDEDEEEEEEKDSHSYESVIPDFFTNNEPKKNVEHVLAEFAKKDRSDCTKTLRQGMTCYQCTNKAGLKHEECMFVSESAPKSTQLAYKEHKQFDTKPETSTPPADGSGAESNVVTSANLVPTSTETILTTTSIPSSTTDGSSVVTTSYVPESKKKHLFKKYIPTDSVEQEVENISLETVGVYTLITTPSSIIEKSAKRLVKRSVENEDPKNEEDTDKVKGTGKELKDKSPSSLSSLDDIANPQEFVEESRGAFWADTVPKYSKELGLSLPKYMLQKSEHESFFDDFLGKG